MYKYGFKPFLFYERKETSIYFKYLSIVIFHKKRSIFEMFIILAFFTTNI
jgi:hypothetical protein